VSTAKRAFDSTLRRVLNYTAEIIMSIILLIIVCIPLAFTIPMWLQNVLIGTPRTEMTINLVAWFGYDGALWITLLLGLVSFFLSYVYVLKMKPGITSAKDENLEAEDLKIPEEKDETPIAEDLEVEEEIAAEDQEEDEEEQLDLDEIEDTLEDMEDDEEDSEGED